MKKYFLKKALFLNGFKFPVGTALNGSKVSNNKYGASTVLVELNSMIFRIRKKNLIEFNKGDAHTSRAFRIKPKKLTKNLKNDIIRYKKK